MAVAAVNATGASAYDGLNVRSSFVTSPEPGLLQPGIQKLIRIDTAGLPVLPPSAGIQFIGNRILFLANSRMEEKMISPHVSFGKIQVYSALPGQLAFSDMNIFSPAREFTFPPDAVTMSNDHTKLYFTVKPSRRKPEQIYEATVRLSASGQIEWTGHKKPLSFCNAKNIFTHPALSSDGSFMVFSSDITGTNGGMDLFISYREGDAWSDPRNLGADINSDGDELYPFLDNKNNLYFSSNKTGGYGGYDIYVAVLDGQNWFRAVSLTEAVNTPDDDIAFRIDNTGLRTAFFTIRNNTGTTGMTLMKIIPDPAAPAPGIQDLSDYIPEMMIKDEGRGEKKIAYSLSRPVEYPSLMPVDTIMPPEPEVAEVKGPIKKTEVKKPVKKTEVKEPVEMAKVKTIAVIKEAETEERMKKEDVSEKPLMNLPLAEVKLPPEPIEKTVAVTKTPVASKTPATVKPAAENKEKVEDAIYLSGSKEIIEGVIYRVQFSASMSPKESIEVIIEGKRYKTFGYFYGGAYRTTVGEFNTLAEARTLQSIMRKLGYNQAFVVAFRYGERIVYYLNKDTF